MARKDDFIAEFLRINSVTGSTNIGKIATKKSDMLKAGFENNWLLIDVLELYVNGESKNEPIEKSYANGSIIPENFLIHGKNFSLTFYIVGNMNVIVNELSRFQSLVMKNKVDISTNNVRVKNCVAQNVNIDSLEHGQNYTGIMTVTALFSSESATPTFGSYA